MPKTMYSERTAQALALVAEGFRDVPRKGTEIPYLTHLLQVGLWAAERGGDEDQMLAGFLHDYLEDVEGATEDELAALFGERVARMVAALSDSVEHPKPPWKQRKVTYLEHLRGEPAEVKLVSACDKLHNATCILRDLKTHGDALWDRFQAGREGTLWYYRAVVDALAEGWEAPIVDELRSVVDAIHAEAE